MQIEIRPIGPTVANVILTGRLTAGFAADLFGRTIDQLLERRYLHLVVNLKDVELMDCAGVGQLAKCLQRARRAGGSLRLASPNRRLRQLLSVLKLDTVLDIVGAEDIALALALASAGEASAGFDWHTVDPQCAAFGGCA